MESLLHYHITGKLGEGRHGTTYLAWDPGLDRVVTIKVLDCPRGLSEDRWRRSLEAVKRFSGIEDDHVARFYSLEDAEGKQFIVREYVEGESISRLVENGPIDYARVLRIALGATLGLKALHENGLVHGNVSSDNIIVSSKGRVKLVGCGLGLDEKESAEALNDTKNIAFSAPEQLRTGEATVQTDFYSLGVVMYHLLVGQLPFLSENRDSVRERILNEPVSFSSDSAKQVWGDARLLIGKLLAKKPSGRFSNAQELYLTLQEMISFQTESVTTSDTRRFSSPRLYLMISFLVLLFVIFWIVITSYPR